MLRFIIRVKIKMTNFTKRKAQMKSSSYYLFWGIATVAVVAGQVYVGTGYRQMAKSMNRWFEETIDIITMPRRNSGGYMPMQEMVDPDAFFVKSKQLSFNKNRF